MLNRYLITIVLACLGIAAIISLQGSPRLAQVLAPMDTAHNPVDAVQSFYSAIERGDWLRVRALTTRKCWEQLEKMGQIKNWQEQFKQDHSLEFAGFLIQNSRIEQKTAVVEGQAQWVSALGTVPRTTQTIILREGQGGWSISYIQAKESAEVVESFYAYLSQGQWDKAKALVYPDVWRSLESQGIIAKVKRGFLKAPYVTASIKSVSEEGNLSQIKVELFWLSHQTLSTQATVKVSKTGDKWTIRQFEGGWPK